MPPKSIFGNLNWQRSWPIRAWLPIDVAVHRPPPADSGTKLVAASSSRRASIFVRAGRQPSRDPADFCADCGFVLVLELVWPVPKIAKRLVLPVYSGNSPAVTATPFLVDP
eukprot:4209338-Prymnesium_polylepis.2